MITKMDKAKMINDAVMSTALREAREEGIEEGFAEGIEARTIVRKSQNILT